MHCSACGAANKEGSAFCGSCGHPIVGFSVAPAAATPYVGNALPSAAHTDTRPYAGFWLRFVAYLIDGLLSGAVVLIVGAIAFGFLGIGNIRALTEGMNQGTNEPNPVFPAMLFVTIMTLVLVSLVVSWLYFAGMESSVHQGTLGKMAMGLIVTNMTGQPVTFARASGRFFSKLITGLVPLFIGYIMAGFTEKKQALHDMIASCLVLRKA